MWTMYMGLRIHMGHSECPMTTRIMANPLSMEMAGS